ncbi:MAG TPA: hypothetical protein DDW52_09330, partial [Planctomycetaceae bacterium]|nr:hypothetical protein [Planctomycetaceae bacterium]
RLAGRRFVGEHDWYREGAKVLLALQNPTNGQFASGSTTGNSKIAETAFGILFLAKGKRQLVVSRLQYGRNLDWNRHAPAIPNLTAHTELAWKRDLTWQNVVLERTNLQELLDTPVLFISGTRPPQFTDPQKKLLKDYVDNGGFIFAEGCVGDGCDGSTFEAAFNALVQELFEKPLTRLPPEHPIWTAESRLTPDELPEGTWLYGVESCCRLGVVYCPTSLSCRWSLSPAYGAKPDYSETVQTQLDNFTKIGLNVLAYATGRELKEKLDLVTVLEEKLPPTRSSRNILFLPVLRHNAGADDVPMAAPKLLQWLSNEVEIHTNTEKRLISITENELQKYPIVFIHGRGTLKLTEAQRLSLKTFLDNGGFLIASSVCGDTQFSDSFRSEMATVLDQPLDPITSRDSMLTDSFGGFDIRQLRVIDPDVTGDSIVGNKRSIVPRLELGRSKQRISVVFSPLDISCALESRHSLQCKGYIREDAARLGINILLFAMLQQ